MPTTPSRAFRYPANTEPVANGAGAIENLARDLDTALADSGWVTLPTAGTFTATSGYTPAVRKVGKLVTIRGAVSYQSGSLYGVNLVALPIGYRPEVNTWLGQVHSGAGAGGLVGTLLALTGGSVQIPSGYGEGSLPVGTVIPLVGTFYTAQ